MRTVLEGEFDQVMDVVKQCFQAMAADCSRIQCSIKFDYRQGHQGRLDSKTRSVEQKLGRELKKLNGISSFRKNHPSVGAAVALPHLRGASAALVAPRGAGLVRTIAEV